jgi:diguanylate cyclase (GGDEF)-like protein
VNGWHERARTLRAQYLKAAGERLARLEGALQELQGQPQNSAAIRELHQQFHALSGTGAPYGFPAISRLGLEGQDLCARVRRANAVASRGDVERARELIEKLGEEISRGARAESSLADAIAGTEPETGAEGTSRRDRPRILAVDDDPEFAAFVAAVLTSGGYECHVCNHPREFEAEIAEIKPDLILLDVVLPGTTGYELARRIRQEERYATVPILFLTGQGEIEARIEAMRAGGDEHLVKPVLPNLLLSAVAARLERAHAVQNLLHRDGLTRLLTHSSFLEQAQEVVAWQRRNPPQGTALVLMDLDNFKAVNDTYGHQTGDRILMAFAAFLRRRLRHSDIIGRYGGEEFAAILEGLRPDQALGLVSRLGSEFAAIEHESYNGERLIVTFSAGLALLRPDMDLSVWVGNADRALYAAKSAGRNQVLLSPA